MNKHALFAVLAVCLLSVQPASAFQYGVDLYLNVAEEYNDNIFLDKDSKIFDYITRISPGLDLSMQGARIEAHIAYAPTFNIYARESDQNNTSQSFSANTRYTASERTNFTLSGSYLKTTDINDLRNVADVGPIATQTKRTLYSVSGDVSHALTSALSLALGASYSSSDSDDPNDDNVKTTSGHAGLTYTLSAATSLSANATYSSYNYEISSDSTGQTYTLGVSHKFSPTLTGSVTGGVALTRNEDTGKTDSGFNGGASISKTFERGSASLSYTQGITPSTDQGETLQYQTASLNLTRKFGERLNGSVYASYNKYKSLSGQATDTDDESINAGASLSYTLTPWASLSLAYSYINFNDKIDNVNDYTNNIVALAIRLNYSTRPGWPAVKPTSH
jgi:Putative beta-barrel porin 2